MQTEREGEREKLGVEGVATHTTSTLHLSSAAGSCRVTFLPLNAMEELGKKPKFRQLFNTVYFSNGCVCTHVHDAL